MLRTCLMELHGSWDKYLPLMEFAYNNSYHSSLGMAPYVGSVELQFVGIKLGKDSWLVQKLCK